MQKLGLSILQKREQGIMVMIQWNNIVSVTSKLEILIEIGSHSFEISLNVLAVGKRNYTDDGFYGNPEKYCRMSFCLTVCHSG